MLEVAEEPLFQRDVGFRDRLVIRRQPTDLLDVRLSHGVLGWLGRVDADGRLMTGVSRSCHCRYREQGGMRGRRRFELNQVLRPRNVVRLQERLEGGSCEENGSGRLECHARKHRENKDEQAQI